MFRLFQESLQLLAGTLHAHLQRRNARSRELRDLLAELLLDQRGDFG